MQSYIIHLKIMVQYTWQENEANWQSLMDEIFQILVGKLCLHT